jgi:hypothetical protein
VRARLHPTYHQEKIPNTHSVLCSYQIYEHQLGRVENLADRGCSAPSVRAFEKDDENLDSRCSYNAAFL